MKVTILTTKPTQPRGDAKRHGKRSAEFAASGRAASQQQAYTLVVNMRLRMPTWICANAVLQG